MFWTAGCVISAALLWLGPEVSAAAPNRSSTLSWALKACALTLATCGLWWPGHLGAALATPSDSFALTDLAWPVAFALALLARLGADAASRTTRAAFVALGSATMLTAYGHALVTTPQFMTGSGSEVWSSAIATALGAAALIGLNLQFKAGRKEKALRGALALALAALLATAASTPQAASAGIPGSVWPEALLLVGLLLMALLLVGALRAAGDEDNATARRAIAKPAPTVDNLTKLPTRLYFEERLAAAAMRADAKSSRLALFFIDLDGFKPVNDTYGHSVGDRVLEQVGQRLNAQSRGKDVVARVGGDEFLLLLSDVDTEESLVPVATRLIAALSHPYTVDEREVIISCSVGISLYPDGCSHGKLIARADAAMYSSKRAGGSRHCFYSPTMDADAERQFDLLRDLRKALQNNEFELLYQPKIDVASGKVTATEALLRWRHPTRGTILPGVFIPIAERFGLIVAVGNWVIEDACRQARAWRDKGLRMRVAINLSAHQMRQDDIVERITDSLQRHRIHASLLTCEITETAAMEDTKATQETFRRLGELGTHLSIDDFGTGYSSLSYLRKLPAEELKIDRSFVTDLENSADARAVVDAVIKLAHALGLKVVAEGVENKRQQQILIDMECDEMQGFLFAKPMSARALQVWAINDRADETEVFRQSLFDESRQSEPV
ncbi:MAG: bifunctional diguanylate cyclase/phosphodiesterase [Caldimonas sp.]